MEQIAGGDTAAALETLGRLYAAGKDVGSALGELSGLTRDLLLRRTAPQGAAVLLTGGFDETTMRALGERFSAPRLMQMLALLQRTTAELSQSVNRRTDAELCLIRLCDVTLNDSVAGLTARLTRLEQMVGSGTPVSSTPVAQSKPVAAPPAADDLPPWEEERPPLPPEPEERPVPQQPAPIKQQEKPATYSAPAGKQDAGFWPEFAAGLRGSVPPSAHPYLINADLVCGTWKDGAITLWVKDEFTKAMLNRPAITEGIAKAASVRFGQPARTVFSIGRPPQEQVQTAVSQPEPGEDALDELLDFGSKFDNIVIE